MPKAARIFIATRDQGEAELLATEFNAQGFRASAMSTPEELERRLQEQDPDAVILEWDDHEAVRAQILETANSTGPVVFATAEAPAVADVVDAVRQGCRDVFERPFFAGEMTAAVTSALEERRSQRATSAHVIKGTTEAPRPKIIGSSPSLRRLLDSMALVTKAPKATVLIEGESGTGKELIARSIHLDGARKDRPFLAINCATLTENLLEAELFGYEEGAFTGALKSGKKGLFESSDGGTLFLDEIGELAQGLQAKLLRVLQEGAFKRVGGVRDLTVDVRIIAATNRDLREEVAAGRFRDDLFYRLNVVPLRVPALRERKGDIPELARHFLEQSARELRKEIRHIAPEAAKALENHDWPGNVRELRNACEYGAIVCDGATIERRHLIFDDVQLKKAPVEAAPKEATLRSLKEMESELIEVVLNETRFNITRAAGILGINRSTLYSKMKDYGLERTPRTRMRQSVG